MWQYAHTLYRKYGQKWNSPLRFCVQPALEIKHFSMKVLMKEEKLSIHWMSASSFVRKPSCSLNTKNGKGLMITHLSWKVSMVLDSSKGSPWQARVCAHKQPNQAGLSLNFSSQLQIAQLYYCHIMLSHEYAGADPEMEEGGMLRVEIATHIYSG